MIETTTENITYSPRNPRIIIDKPEPRSGEKVWVSLGNVREAQWRLQPEAFSLYMYFVLCNNKEAFKFLSSKFCEEFNLTEEQYLDAYNELLDNDYLVPATNKDPILCFHDYPLVFPYLTSLDDDVEDAEEGEW